ncbi:hypothetical protein ACERNI_10670 [Camelimonas sp. ID_303_24]
MTLKETLLGLIEAYCAAREISLGRASTLIFGDGTKVAKMLAGSDITTVRLEAAVQWLSDNWPADQPWPRGFARPARSPAGVAA